MTEPPQAGGPGKVDPPADGNGAGGADAQSAGGPAEGPAGNDPDEEKEAAGQPRNPFVVYNFHGPVDAMGARFGITDQRPNRRSTGRVDPAEVDRALGCYLPPSPYQTALAILRDRHLLGLPGEEDTGRRTGAFALLQAVTGGAPLTSLSPTYTLAELGRYAFRAGRGYLVADRLPEATADEEQRFEAERLLSRLAATGAYLVVTTTPPAVRAWPEEVVVHWDRPDPEELLHHCLAQGAVTLTDPQLAEVRARVAQRPAPREVVALVGRISASGVEAALSVSDDEDRRRVRAWFETATRSRREVVEVAAVAFAYGLPQRKFERLCARLQALTDTYSLGHRSEATTPDDGALPPARAARNGADSLIAIVRGEPAGPRRVALRSPRHRETVLVELADRYGDELWEPLDGWLRRQAGTTDEQERGALSLGVALHAHNEPDEVHTLLEEWADGTVMERLTASYVLSWMCLDDDLAPASLRMATGWAVGAGPRRAWTAAVALGGELGVRYQTEALRWLSYLSVRGERVARPARESIADLFRGADHDPRGATALLRFLHRWLRRMFDEGDVADIRSTLRAVVTVLRAGGRDSTAPVAAQVLRDQPDTAGMLGALWAESLRSAPHRSDAIDALRATVCSAGPDQRAEQAVRALGAAIRGTWSGEERRIRLQQLGPALGAPPADSDAGQRLLKVLREVLMETDDDD